MHKDELISSSEKSLLYLALAKLDAVISGCKEPISLTTSPINESHLSLLPSAAKVFIFSALLLPIIRLLSP